MKGIDLPFAFFAILQALKIGRSCDAGRGLVARLSEWHREVMVLEER